MLKPVVIIVLMLISNLARADFEIKGVEVDKPANCAHINSLELRKGTFSDPCSARKKNWFTTISFLNGQSNMMITQSPDGIVLSVVVSDFDFNLALASLTDKFGKPEIANSTIQNRMGAKFDQTEAIWREGEKSLSLTRHGIEIGKPVLILSGNESSKEIKNSVKPSSNL